MSSYMEEPPKPTDAELEILTVLVEPRAGHRPRRP